ncbi:putative damage-inducible protein DinB [Paenibacillus cellulosilyticus]|uniref:Putative damage-inducible protein DinB n=1 Tax=Paenibacillus cellulosilyticus TaxID=375489 RepID=A0A2V2YZB9_9BACL|nr:DinB family protein [Paenibacillus cellulosilyticus]PWV98674.1 putative damage-inducible protein DinB [Paenibacillus cellulosilyticus]QKS43820.1 DinB family protein [Paenibacillus cellulosilyticus]
MIELLQQQYDWVKSARNNLFAFLEEIPPLLLHQALPSFGRGTILKTHIHVADSYRLWLGSFAFRLPPDHHQDISIDKIKRADVPFVRNLFAEVDDTVQRFLNATNDWSEPIVHPVFWQDEPHVASPLHLFTHVVTHEFHHKGQIVSMARQLGYPPPADDRLGGIF